MVGVQLVTLRQREEKEVIVVLVKPVGMKMHQLYIRIALIGDFVIQNVIEEMEMKIRFRHEYTS